MKKCFVSILVLGLMNVSILCKMEIVNAEYSKGSSNIVGKFLKESDVIQSARGNQSMLLQPVQEEYVNEHITSSEEPIEIFSDFIAQLISEQLKIDFQHLFTKSQIEEITKLEITSNKDFKESDLLDIAKLFNLRDLKLVNLDLTNIDLLANNTQLELINLKNNQIKDCSPIARLAKIKRLDLSYNQLEEVESLSNLSNLKYLYLGNNKIENIQLPFASINLLELYVDNNPIVELSNISNFPFLRKLSFKGTLITNFQEIVSAQNLIYLSIGEAPIGNEDIICLSKLSKLVELRMTNTLVSDLYSISHLSNLTKLILNNNRIVDVEGLSNLSKLTFLDLEHNQIKDVNSLSKLSYLKEFNLANNRIDSIQPVKNSVTNAQNQLIVADKKEVWDGQLTILNEVKLDDLEDLGELSIVAEVDGQYNVHSNQIQWTTLNELSQLPSALGYTFSFSNDKRYSGTVTFPIEGHVNPPSVDSLRYTETKIKGFGRYKSTILAKVNGQIIGESQVQEDSTFEMTIVPQKPNTKIILTQVLFGKESLGTELIVDLVKASDFNHQKWLINEVNRQLAPKEIDKNVLFDDLEKIKTIVLNNKKLEGSIPSGISYLTHLHVLELDTNRLMGEIPESIGEFSYLTHLSLSNNQLMGTIPVQIANLKKIEKIELTGNKLTGAIPRSIGNLINLKELWLDNNGLTENVPTSIGSLANLEVLNFSFNQLNGSIPSNISNLEKLELLNLSSNNLSGVIPASIGHLEDLYFLNLGNNNLNGTIPASVGNLIHLQTFDVRNNQLVGKVDNIIETLALVSQELYVQGNQLTINSNDLPTSIASNQNWGNNFIQDRSENSTLNSYHIEAKERVYPENNRIYLFDSSKGDAFLDLHGKDQDNQFVNLWPKHTYQILNEQGKEIYNGPADPDYYIEWDGSFKYQINLDGASKNSNNVLTFLVGEGGLSIYTSLPTLDFQPSVVEQKGLIKRKQKNWSLKVNDTRRENRRSPWRVTVNLAENFCSQDYELRNPLVFAQNNSIEAIKYGRPHTIYTQKKPIEGETIIRWEDGEGVLMKIPQGSYKGNYKGTLNFTIIDSI